MADVLETLLVLIRGDSTQLQRELDKIQRESAETKAKVSRNLDFRDIGAGLTGLAGGGGVLYALREMAQESATTTAQMRSFENTVRRTGTSGEEASRMVRQIASDFGILESQVQAAATPLLKVGLDAETTGETLRALGSSAGLLGNDIASSMTTGSQGVAMLRSELLETSGITVNASQTWGPYAASVGKSTAALSDNEKALAFALGVIREAKPDVEDFTDSFSDFARSQAASRAELAEFRNDIGRIAQEGLTPLNKALTGSVGFFNDLPDGVQRSATAFVAAGAGATALAAGAGTLALVLGPLAGPAGLFILVAAGVAAFLAATNEAPTPVRTLETAIDDLKKAHEEYETAVANASEAETTAAQQRLTNARDTAQAALEEARAGLGKAEQRYTDAEAANYGNPEASFGLAILRDDVEKYRRLVAEQETALKLIDMRESDRLTNPIIRGGGVTDTATGTGSPPPAATQTAVQVFNEVGEAGARANERAALLGDTLEERLGAAEERANLLSGALDNLLAMPDATPAMLENIAERLTTTQQEVETLQRALEDLGKTPAPGDVGRIDELRAAGLSRGDPNGSRLDAVFADSSERTELTNQFAEGQERAEAAARQRADAEQILNDTLEAQRQTNLELLEQARLIIADTNAAQAAALRRAQTDPNLGRGGLRQSQIDAANQEDAGREFQNQLSGFTGSDEELAALADSIRLAGVEGEITTRKMTELLELIEKMSGKTVNITVKADVESDVPLLGEGGAEPSAEFDRSKGVGPGEREIGKNDSWDRAFDANSDLIIDAGEQFNQSIAQAGLDFAGNLSNALADGKITGNEAAGIGGALGSAGGAALGTLLLGPGLGTQLGSIVGNVLGGAIGGLFGGDDESDSRSTAAKDLERRGGAASVNFNIFATQNNSFAGGLDKPQNEAGLDRQVRKIVGEVLAQADPKKYTKATA